MTTTMTTLLTTESMTQLMTQLFELPAVPELADVSAVTWPMVAAGGTGLLILGAAIAAVVWATRRAVRALSRGVETGRLTIRRVLIVVAVVAALGVAGIGGARSFNAVSDKFDSPLVPLVADGMIIACTALRLAALTRGWRIPGALVTTYVFIGGTVWLNIDTAHGIGDAVAHALAPLAYAVLVEMLAHLLRLHLGLVEPPERRRSGVAGLARLGWLTWVTSPIVTTRVGLHLARTGSDDPVAARALVQQLIRMSSRLRAVCPSPLVLGWWPFESARAARSAALQTVRDGLLSASELAARLPAIDRLTPGELLALVDSAALTSTGQPATSAATDNTDRTDPTGGVVQPNAPVWLVAYLLGALRTAPTAAPVHDRSHTAPTAPIQQDHRNGAVTPSSSSLRSRRTDEDDLSELRRVSEAEHGGAPLSQREITRVLDCGFSKARRLADLAGWLDPAPAAPAASTGTSDTGDDRPTETRGQLQLVAERGEIPDDDENERDRALETSRR